MDGTEDIPRNIASVDAYPDLELHSSPSTGRIVIRRCLVAFLIGYLLGESNVSITALLL